MTRLPTADEVAAIVAANRATNATLTCPACAAAPGVDCEMECPLHELSREPARCAICGTQYTARGWFWLEPLDDKGESRACAVPGCGFAVKRTVAVALRPALETTPDNDASPTIPTNSQERNRQ